MRSGTLQNFKAGEFFGQKHCYSFYIWVHEAFAITVKWRPEQIIFCVVKRTFLVFFSCENNKNTAGVELP